MSQFNISPKEVSKLEEKFEIKNNERKLKNFLKSLTFIALVAMSIYHFYASGFTVALDTTTDAADRLQARLPAFATRIEALGYGDRRQLYVDSGSAEAQTMVGSGYNAQTTMDNAQNLGLYTFKSYST